MSELVIKHAPEADRYEAYRDDVLVGYIDYEVEGNVLTLTHTIVPEEFGGQGIATAMARGVLDAIRDSGKQIVPECPFLVKWVEKNPDCADLVAGA